MIQNNTPLRKCIACGLRNPKSEFIVVVRAPRAQPGIPIRILDGSEKKEGRGSYICKNSECLNKARKSRKLERIFKRKLEDRIYSELEEAVTAHE